MAGLKISHFRRIACFYKRIETGVDQFTDTAAENRLFTEQIGFRLLTEGCLKNTGTACTDTACIGECDLFRIACEILFDTDQGRNALAFGIRGTNNMSRALRRNHDDINVLGRFDKLEMNVEAMCECERIAFLHMRSDKLVIDIGSSFIRYQHHYNITRFCSTFDVHDPEVRMGLCKFFRLLPVSASLTQTNDNIHAAFREVFRMCVSLRTKADNSYGLSVEYAEVAV